MPSITELETIRPTLLSISNRTISGSVLLLGAGVVRRIAVFKNSVREEYRNTMSSPDGSWQVDVVAGDNDRFRCVAIGEGDNENSLVYDKVVAG